MEGRTGDVYLQPARISPIFSTVTEPRLRIQDVKRHETKIMQTNAQY